MMKNDIQNRKDIRKLVGTFYEKLLKDEVFNYIFLEVAKVDVLEHMDIIIDFWESALFQAGKYKDDLIEVHLNLNQQFNYGLNKEHFNKWLALFNQSVDEIFEGENATGAKTVKIRTNTLSFAVRA